MTQLGRVSDALAWAGEDPESLVEAAGVVREATGAVLAPVFLLDESCRWHLLVADDEQRRVLGEGMTRLDASVYVRPPWLSQDESPMWGAEQPEAWARLPEDFKSLFGTSYACVPIHADGRHLGAMILAFDADVVRSEPVREFLAMVGRLFGGAVYRWQSARKERELGALLERRRLSDELHVDLSQQIAALGLHVGLVEIDAADPSGRRLAADVERLCEMVTEVKQSLRHQMLGLRADADLIERSLAEQVRVHADSIRHQLGVPVRVECLGCGRAGEVPLPIAAQMVRVLREALTNAQRHSRASSIDVRLVADEAKVRLVVEDDGVGFDPAVIPESRLGVSIMTERMEQVGGALRVTSRPGGGTAVVAECPLRRAGTGSLSIAAALDHV